MRKHWKTILRITCMALVGIVVGFNIYLWNAQSLMGDALPMPMGYGAAVVLSGSMEPTLECDDLIFVKEESEYHPDDIVVYQSGNLLVVHRILSIEEEMAVTKGDANNVADEPIALSAIKGRVIGRMSGMGPVVNAIKTPVGTVLLAGLAILLPELGFRMEKKKQEEELDKIKEEIRKLKAEQE